LYHNNYRVTVHDDRLLLHVQQQPTAYLFRKRKTLPDYIERNVQDLKHYKWGDSYVILLTTVTAAMLEVYFLQQCNVINLRILANCCVWNYSPVENTVCE